MSKVDGTSLTGMLNMELVPGVTSQKGVWHRVRVVVTATQVRAWVDGRPMGTVIDSTFSNPGYVGQCAATADCTGPKSSFRN